MVNNDGKKSSWPNGVRRSEREDQLLTNENSSQPIGHESSDSQPVEVGSGGEVCEGTDRGRPRPVTHGKTLGYLIKSLADQIADSEDLERRTASSEAARRKRLLEQKADLEKVLADWQASVDSLPKNQ